MELTTRGRYAVMALAELAKNGSESPLPLAAISARQSLSLDYLEQLFMKLRRAGLVESVRGRSGGYKLGRPPENINIAAIMSAVDEDTRMTRCHDSQNGGCQSGERCTTHHLWQALGDQIESFLERVSLKDVVDNRPLNRTSRQTYLMEQDTP